MKETVNFKPIKITELTEQKKAFEKQFNDKISAFNELIKATQEYIPVDDVNAFLDNGKLTPETYFKTFEDVFLNKYKNDFPPISVQKMYELMNFDINALNVKITLINSIEIDVNFSTGEPFNTPSWDIYTETPEQNKTFDLLNTMLTAIKELKKNGKTVYPAPICQALNGAVMYDFKDNELKANPNFILGKMRF